MLNTCAIRENAQDKVFGYFGRCKHLKKEKRYNYCLCGCMAQEEIGKEIRDKHPYIDIVFGTHNLSELPSLIEEANNKKKQNIEVYSNSDIDV